MNSIPSAFAVLSMVLVLFTAGCGENASDSRASADPFTIGSPDAAHKVNIYYSVGCPGCLIQFDEHLPALRAATDRGDLQIGLFDMSSEIGTPYSIVRSRLASSFMWCIDLALEDKDQLDLLSEFITFLKAEIITNDTGVGKQWHQWVWGNPDFVEPGMDVIKLIQKYIGNYPGAFGTCPLPADSDFRKAYDARVQSAIDADLQSVPFFEFGDGQTSTSLSDLWERMPDPGSN